MDLSSFNLVWIFPWIAFDFGSSLYSLDKGDAEIWDELDTKLMYILWLAVDVKWMVIEVYET